MRREPILEFWDFKIWQEIFEKVDQPSRLCFYSTEIAFAVLKQKWAPLGDQSQCGLSASTWYKFVSSLCDSRKEVPPNVYHTFSASSRFLLPPAYPHSHRQEVHLAPSSKKSFSSLIYCSTYFQDLKVFPKIARTERWKNWFSKLMVLSSQQQKSRVQFLRISSSFQSATWNWKILLKIKKRYHEESHIVSLHHMRSLFTYFISFMANQVFHLLLC